jgi:hypothetical protein
MAYDFDFELCVVCLRVADMPKNAVGPTEMCALSRSDLGSERGARRDQSLPSVCDPRRGQRDQEAQISRSRSPRDRKEPCHRVCVLQETALERFRRSHQLRQPVPSDF